MREKEAKVANFKEKYTYVERKRIGTQFVVIVDLYTISLTVIIYYSKTGGGGRGNQNAFQQQQRESSLFILIYIRACHTI